MLNEIQIKTVVIDYLLEKRFLDNAVLINEMNVANWSRRADLAVANGKLHAFEIKSDFDSLKRLDDQVSVYLSRFDKVTVVTTSKFLEEVLEKVPPGVEVWHVAVEKNEVGIRVARRGKARPLSNKLALCGFLLKGELVSLLRKHGYTVSADNSRELLCRLAEQVPAPVIRDAVICALKKRYAQTFQKFLSNWSGRTQIEDIRRLSRSQGLFQEKDRPSPMGNPTPEAMATPANARIFNLSEMRKRVPDLPEDTPRFILCRRQY